MSSEARILIVEDQRVTASVLTTSLDLLNRGYRIVDVPSGEEAMLETRREAFDLIITNHRLPGISGPDLIRRIRRSQPQLKAIMLTDQDLKKAAKECADLDLKALLTRPVDAEQFIAAVNRALHAIEGMDDVTIVVEDKLGPLPEFDSMAIARLMPTLLYELGAMGLAFISRTGQVRNKDGIIPKDLRLNELAVLLAANFTTTTEITSYLGGERHMSLHYHRGDQYDIFALSVGIHYFLTIIFEGYSQKQMGPVLRYGSQVAEQMLEVIETFEQPEDEAAYEEALEAAPVEPTPEPAYEEPAPSEKKKKKTDQLNKDKAFYYENEYIQYTAREEEAQLSVDSGPMEQIQLDDAVLGNLDAELETLDVNAEGFWSEAAGDVDSKVRADALSLEEAQELGLLDDE